ncbi:MAG: hypothetical protein ACLTOV_05750 [Phocaeicola sp.]
MKNAPILGGGDLALEFLKQAARVEVCTSTDPLRSSSVCAAYLEW